MILENKLFQKLKFSKNGQFDQESINAKAKMCSLVFIKIRMANIWVAFLFYGTSSSFNSHPVIFVNIIFYFCRTEFSSPSNSNKEHELTLRTDDEKKQCFDTAEIRMRKEFNPSANENPLQFNATLIPVEKNSNFDGKLGRLAKKVIGAKYLSLFFLLSFPQNERKIY